MGAYNNMDKAVAGLVSGLDKRVESWAAAEAITFGRALFAYVGGAKKAYQYHNDRSTVTLDADTVTSNAIAWSVIVAGVTYSGTVNFTSNHETTMNALVAAIEAAVPNSVVTLSATPFRVFTVDVDGQDPVVDLVITGGVSQPADTVAVSSRQVFIGVSMFTQKENGYYLVNEAVNVLARGEIYVSTYGAVNANAAAYVIKAAGSTKGLFSATSASNYDTKCFFRETVAATGLALVEVRGIN